MAITGKFEADFSPFVREVDRGNAALGRFERGQRNVENATTSAEGRLRGTARAIGEVDNVLNLFGVHLGPVRQAADELGKAAGKTTEELGALGTAGLVAGAAFAGWQIGRWIADLGGLDEKIGDVTAHLLGMRTASDEAADAAADQIARAQGKIEGLTVLSASTAQAINKAEAEAAIARNRAASDEKMRQTAYLKTAEALEAINADIKKISDEGLVDQLTADINAGALSAKDLAAAYGISESALARYTEQAKKSAAVEESNAIALAKTRDELTKARVEREENAIRLAELDKGLAETARNAQHAQIQMDVMAAEAIHKKDIEVAESQARARREVEKTTRALEEERRAAETAALAIGSSFQYDLSTAAGLAQFKAANPRATVNAGADYFKTHTLQDAIAAGVVTGPGFVASTAGGVKPYTAPTFPIPTVGGDAGLVAGGGRAVGVTINAPIYVSGVYDPASAASLQKTVSGALGRVVSTARR